MFKKIIYSIISLSILFSYGNSLVVAAKEYNSKPETRIFVADTSVGYIVYRDSILCPGGDCWDGKTMIYGKVQYYKSYHKTGVEKCSVNGDVKTCYYQFNIDGQLTFVYN